MSARNSVAAGSRDRPHRSRGHRTRGRRVAERERVARRPGRARSAAAPRRRRSRPARSAAALSGDGPRRRRSAGAGRCDPGPRAAPRRGAGQSAGSPRAWSAATAVSVTTRFSSETEKRPSIGTGPPKTPRVVTTAGSPAPARSRGQGAVGPGPGCRAEAAAGWHHLHEAARQPAGLRQPGARHAPAGGRAGEAARPPGRAPRRRRGGSTPVPSGRHRRGDRVEGGPQRAARLGGRASRSSSDAIGHAGAPPRRRAPRR